MNGKLNLGDYTMGTSDLTSIEGRVVSVGPAKEYFFSDGTVEGAQDYMRITIDALTTSVSANFPLPSTQTMNLLRNNLVGSQVFYMCKQGMLEAARAEGDRCRVQRLKILSGPLEGETISDIAFY